MKLRPYQIRAISDLRQAYAAGRKAPCLVIPTGGGKTPCAAEIIRLCRSRSRKVVFLAGRVELLDQAVRKLNDAGVTDVRVIQGERDTATSSDVIVASVQTFAAERWRGSLPAADLCVIDEAHHVKARTWLESAAQYPLKLALTATPQRGDGSPLGDVLDAIVVGATVAELQSLGHLVPCRVLAPPAIMDPRTLAMEPVAAYLQHCPGSRCVVFAGTVEHASKLAAEFRARGVGAEHVSGSVPNRPDVIARHARGEFPVLVNVNLVVEGYDDPSLESAIFARRFTHVGGYLQAIGRVLRPYAGKTQATVIDLCGSALVHGTPEIERAYSLDGKAISSVDRKAIRQCSTCGGVSVSRDVCPYCATEFPTATRGIPVAGHAGVSEISPKVKPTSWPMRAKKRGLCSACGASIEAGNWIMYSSTRRLAQHVKCAAKAVAA